MSLTSMGKRPLHVQLARERGRHNRPSQGRRTFLSYLAGLQSGRGACGASGRHVRPKVSAREKSTHVTHSGAGANVEVRAGLETPEVSARAAPGCLPYAIDQR